MTETEIRVAVPTNPSGVATDRERISVDAIFDYYNRHFELYGRRLVPVAVGIPPATPVDQRAFAAQIAAMGSFAALESPNGSSLSTFFHGLARERVIAVGLGAWSWLSDRAIFDELHPFIWALNPSVEQVWANLGDFVCRSLANRPAGHGGPSVRDLTRKFGIVVSGRGWAPPTRNLVDGLGACGVEPALVQWDAERDAADGGRSALERLRQAGVTTLICACANVSDTSIGSMANTMGWTDIELLMPWHVHPYTEENRIQRFLTVTQRSHLFGLSPTARVLPVQAQWPSRAIAEARPDLALAPDRYAQSVYDQLLILASGIQAAGPNLTPETFAAGLMSSPFANLEVGVEPTWSPGVGFGPGDHTFIDDYALVWWSEQAEAYGQTFGQAAPPKGSWCYLDRGARFSVGHFPADADARFFNPAEPCR